MMIPGLELGFGIQMTNPGPVDSWAGPYADVGEANATIPYGVRYPGKVVQIIAGNHSDDYHYQDGIDDNNLVLKTSGSGGSNFWPLGGNAQLNSDVIIDGTTPQGQNLLIGTSIPLGYTVINNGNGIGKSSTLVMGADSFGFTIQDIENERIAGISWYGAANSIKFELNELTNFNYVQLYTNGIGISTSGELEISANDIQLNINGSYGDPGQMLMSDGAGYLSWGSIFTIPTTQGYIPYGSSANLLSGTGQLYWDDYQGNLLFNYQSNAAGSEPNSITNYDRINNYYLFGEGNTINGTPSGAVTDGIVVGWRNIIGDGSSYFSGSNSLTFGSGNVNYGKGMSLFGERARSFYSPGKNGMVVALNHSIDFTSVPYVSANGGAFNVSGNTGSQTDGHGALGLYSAIVGGIDHNIPADSPNSVILGGTLIKARPADPNQVYVPNFNIAVTPQNNNDLFQVLVRDGTTGKINYRDAGFVKSNNFLVSNLPSAATLGAGAIVYVPNETGGGVPAFSDGTNWRRMTDRAIVS